MLKKLMAFTLVGIFLLPVGNQVVAFDGSKQQQMTQDISPQRAQAMLLKDLRTQKLIFLDVRTPREFAGKHIDKALNIDFHSKSFEKQLNTLNKNKAYIVYCAVGGRSGKTMVLMKQLGFKEIYNIVGGLANWEKMGLPVVK